MTRRSRPRPSKRTKALIALALFGVLAGVAAYRSHPRTGVLHSAPRAAEAPERAAARPHASIATPTTAPEPRTAGRTSTPLAPAVPPSASAQPHADLPKDSVELRVLPQPAGLFKVSGTPAERLAPGVSVPLNLALINPHAFAVSVRSLAVRVRSIRAPRADRGHACGAQDFAVARYSGPRLRLSPRSRATLGRLGVAPARWPHLSMLDRPVNQDGCKGASLALDYRGAGGR
jgi:hypothetical protein